MTTPGKLDEIIAFPHQGISRVEIEAAFERLRKGDDDPRTTFGDRWLNDRGLLIEDGVIDVAKAAQIAFFTKNNSYPPIMTLERELITLALDLFHGSPNAYGTLTSGGSESLFLATAAAICAARETRPELNEPEILIPESGYPTFEKYGRHFGYKVRRIAIDEEYRADPSAMEKAINQNTVMMLGSMSSWAHGACDPIAELAQIAHKNGLWFHVDACVGGFLAPFVRDLGRDLPDFDFRIPGISSISADFHKYGYSAKGVSGIFYQERELARHQTFVFEDWAAGLYRSPVFTGTRSGGAIASAWAVMRYLGRDGYRTRAAQILKLRDALVSMVAATPELFLIGRAELGTVAIGGRLLNIYSVASHLKERGWAINLLKNPSGIQLPLGPLRDEHIVSLVADFKKAVSDVSEGYVGKLKPLVVYSDEAVDFS